MTKFYQYHDYLESIVVNHLLTLSFNCLTASFKPTNSATLINLKRDTNNEFLRAISGWRHPRIKCGVLAAYLHTCGRFY